MRGSQAHSQLLESTGIPSRLGLLLLFLLGMINTYHQDSKGRKGFPTQSVYTPCFHTHRVIISLRKKGFSLNICWFVFPNSVIELFLLNRPKRTSFQLQLAVGFAEGSHHQKENDFRTPAHIKKENKSCLPKYFSRSLCRDNMSGPLSSNRFCALSADPSQAALI